MSDLVRSKAHVNGRDRMSGDTPARFAKVEYYTTARGYEIKIVGLSPFYLQDIYEGIKVDPNWPDPDTKKVYYEFETAGGAMERHEHNETTVETPDEKAALEAYLAYKAAYEAELSNRIFDAALLEGIELQGIDVETEVVKLAKRRKRSGVVLPEDEVDREIYFIRTVAVGNADDLGYIFERVMARTGLDTKVLSSARNMFQSGVEDESRPNTSGETVDTGGSVEA